MYQHNAANDGSKPVNNAEDAVRKANTSTPHPEAIMSKTARKPSKKQVAAAPVQAPAPRAETRRNTSIITLVATVISMTVRGAVTRLGLAVAAVTPKGNIAFNIVNATVLGRAKDQTFTIGGHYKMSGKVNARRYQNDEGQNRVGQLELTLLSASVVNDPSKSVHAFGQQGTQVIEGYMNGSIKGNLTEAPDLRYTSGGTPVANYTVAINESYLKGNELIEAVHFIPCVQYGDRAVEIAGVFGKGDLVEVTVGNFEVNTWNKEDGSKGRKAFIVSEDVVLLAAKGSGKTSTNDLEDPALPY
jgi:single-strand DNA-binding protein